MNKKKESPVFDFLSFAAKAIIKGKYMHLVEKITYGAISMLVTFSVRIERTHPGASYALCHIRNDFFCFNRFTMSQPDSCTANFHNFYKETIKTY